MNASNHPSEPRVREIFLKALEFPERAAREQFLNTVCGDDTRLRQQVVALLASHQEDSFLERPAFRVEPPPGADPASNVTMDLSAETACEPGKLPGTSRPITTTVRYFGDYELKDEIARGGMGVVYRAKQVSLNRTVALKMILSGKFAGEDDVKRFRTEAEAAANLQHPNIVAIHEIGEHEGRHYFSMDYVEGKNLAQAIGNQPMPFTQAAELLKTIAEAVHYAHQRGTLHRDLKPHNVLIDATGQPRITDFGIAKRVDQESDLTQEGAVMGSPSYMPPEQATGRLAEIGPASDVYSLGAILYQMLTGKAPFGGAMPVDTLRQVIEQEPTAPSKFNDRVPPDLETICLKCLEKKPELRYPSARALAEELERFLNHEPILAKPASVSRKLVSWGRRHPWVITAAAAVMILGLAGFAFGLWQQNRLLEWRRQNPTGRPHIRGSSLEEILLWLAVLVPLILGPLYEYQFRKRRQQPHARSRFARRTFRLGCFTTLLSVGLSLEVVRLWVWSQLFWEDTLAALSLIFAVCWNGLVLVWTSLRQNEAIMLAAEEAEDRHPAFKIEMNFAAFLFAFPLAHWLSLPIGRALVAWADFQSPHGFLANGTYVFTPAMTALYQANLIKLFPMIADVVAIALPVGIAAWRFPKGHSFRVIAPMGIGFIFTFIAVMFSLIPLSMAATSLLLGIVMGLALLAALQMRKVPVGEGATNDIKVNGKAILRVLPWVVLGLAPCAAFLAFLAGQGKPGWWFPWIFPCGLFPVLGVLAGRWKQELARQRCLFAGMLFFLLFLLMGGTVSVPNAKAIMEALPLGPVFLAGYVLYRAASKPVPTPPNDITQPPKP